MNWLVFILGAFAGGTIGTLIMALLITSKCKENDLVIGWDKYNGKDFGAIVKAIKKPDGTVEFKELHYYYPPGENIEENNLN